MKTATILLLLCMAAGPSFAQWGEPLEITEQHCYWTQGTPGDAYSATYTWIVDLSRPLTSALCWGNGPGTWADMIKITVWADEDGRDAGASEPTYVETICDDTRIKRYHQPCYECIWGAFLQGTTHVSSDQMRVTIRIPVLILIWGGSEPSDNYYGWGMAYHIESGQIFDMSDPWTKRYTEFAVQDWEDGTPEPDPRNGGVSVPTEDTTWGAIKSLYE